MYFRVKTVGGGGEGLFEILAGWVTRPGWLGRTTPPPTVLALLQVQTQKFSFLRETPYKRKKYSQYTQIYSYRNSGFFAVGRGWGGGSF